MKLNKTIVKRRIIFSKKKSNHLKPSFSFLRWHRSAISKNRYFEFETSIIFSRIDIIKKTCNIYSFELLSQGKFNFITHE